jgi:predicted amidophosphoribosyltransferase
MAKVSVEEASAAYVSSMRNIAAVGPGVCATCRTFITEDFDRCYPCQHQPSHLDAVVPVTYSEHLGQVHTALRQYKDGTAPSVRRYAKVRLAAILWRFLEAHEPCIANAVGVDGFDIVTVVPSSTLERDEARKGLRTLVGWCRPLAGRVERLLTPTGDMPEGRDYDGRRYRCEQSLDGRNVLLIDDTWTRGGHAQSAGHALRDAGAAAIGFVVIGRHVRREWEIDADETTGDRLDDLPREFDWARCAVDGS